MGPLPMAPSCALDQSAMSRQLERYRQAGQRARVVDRTRRRLTLDLDRQLDHDVIEEAIAVERECCPFFTIDWLAEQRRLTVSVTQPEHESALEAIAFALGLDAPATQSAPD
jgi:hypothetical protein